MTKGGLKLKAQKYIYSRSVREMFSNFRKSHPNCIVSMSLYYRCKPFYVCPPTEREMEGCLCIKCLNPHSLYASLKKCVKDLPMSLSEYLCEGFECGKDYDINFPKLDCIYGKCQNKCEINNSKSGEEGKRVSYYQFEMVIETYYNKEGEEKEYKRTARKDFHDVPLKEVFELLNNAAMNYLEHRYHVLL